MFVMVFLIIFLAAMTFTQSARVGMLKSQLAKSKEETSLALNAAEHTKELSAAPPKPICQCKHGYNVHTEENGCQERLGKTSDGVTTSQTFFCPCAHYTGPIPYPAFYAPDLDF